MESGGNMESGGSVEAVWRVEAAWRRLQVVWIGALEEGEVVRHGCEGKSERNGE